MPAPPLIAGLLSLEADVVRDEKEIEVLSRCDDQRESVDTEVVRAQYAAGFA
jgi:hypothetical protein